MDALCTLQLKKLLQDGWLFVCFIFEVNKTDLLFWICPADQQIQNNVPIFEYRKVASSRPVYYSIFNYFWGATNWDVLLTETCYYSFLQQSIKWVHFQSLLITTSFTIACVLFLQFSSQNGVKSFYRAFLFMIYLIIILGDLWLIVVRGNSSMSRLVARLS